MNFALHAYPNVIPGVSGFRWAVTPNIRTPKPVRVRRTVEAGQTRNIVGRMVMSGRMADVCAELDRLAAREAT